MTFGNRKKSKITSVSHSQTESPKVYLNDKCMNYYLQSTLGSPVLTELLKLNKQEVAVYCSGGGIGSQIQLVEKVLFSYLSNSEMLNIKQDYPLVDRTDGRKRYPKSYGGRKSRARAQKSYR